MRRIRYWTLLVLLLGITVAEAQIQSGNPYGMRRNSTLPEPNIEDEEPKALTAEEIVEQEMPKIIEEAELNDFEQAVVSSILTKYVQKTIELRLLELDPNRTRELLEQIRTDQRAELKAGLPEEKYEALIAMQENGYKPTKKKKKKKKKKD